MNIDELQEVLSAATGFFSTPARPTHRHTPPPSARQGNVVGENHEAQWKHPEPQHGQKAENATGNEREAQADTRSARPRQPELAVCDFDLAVGDLEICHLISRDPEPMHPEHEGSLYPQGGNRLVFPLNRLIFRAFKIFMTIFQKTAWQIGKAFVLRRQPPQGDDPW